jgi:RimJ/RimL family protein N-acetyltransferase
MHPRSDLQLIDIQIATLFVSDSDGRLRSIAEPGYDESELDPAPRFFMGRTKAGTVWRFRHDLPDDLVQELADVCRSEPIATNLADPSPNMAAIRAALQAHEPIIHEERGPAYWIPHRIPPPSVHVVHVSETNAYLLDANFPWKRTTPAGGPTGPLAAAVVQGTAVSICYCARLNTQAAEAGVETVESARGQGYASAAVAAWAAEVRQRGLLPLYSTSWANVASQGVARKLGMVCYAEDWSIT